jgi:SAM-dependent methyltransferase
VGKHTLVRFPDSSQTRRAPASQDTVWLVLDGQRPPLDEIRERCGEPGRYVRAVDNDDVEDGFFGESVATTYDESSGEAFRPEAVDAAVGFLAELAGGGRALELGIGTGRIALPLAERGVPVHGIDLSRPMVARLRAKPGGDAIGVTIGDFATTRVEGAGTFSLAYLVFNTINNLTTQDAQVACFRNVADHLAPGGRFVIEVGVPELRKLPPGQSVVPFQVGDTAWAYDVYDTATQAMSSNYVKITADGRGSFWSIPFRYVWPAELDLMAQLAGMRLRDRWGDWTCEPFTSESGKHVSVWEKPGE